MWFNYRKIFVATVRTKCESVARSRCCKQTQIIPTLTKHLHFYVRAKCNTILFNITNTEQYTCSIHVQCEYKIFAPDEF